MKLFKLWWLIITGARVSISVDETDSPVSQQTGKSELELILEKMQQTVELLKTKNTSSIRVVGMAVHVNLEMLYQNHKDRQQRQMMGDKLAELDGARVIAAYMLFLKDCGLEQQQVCTKQNWTYISTDQYGHRYI